MKLGVQGDFVAVHLELEGVLDLGPKVVESCLGALNVKRSMLPMGMEEEKSQKRWGRR